MPTNCSFRVDLSGDYIVLTNSSTGPEPLRVVGLNTSDSVRRGPLLSTSFQGPLPTACDTTYACWSGNGSQLVSVMTFNFYREPLAAHLVGLDTGLLGPDGSLEARFLWPGAGADSRPPAASLGLDLNASHLQFTAVLGGNSTLLVSHALGSLPCGLLDASLVLDAQTGGSLMARLSWSCTTQQTGNISHTLWKPWSQWGLMPAGPRGIPTGRTHFSLALRGREEKPLASLLHRVVLESLWSGIGLLSVLSPIPQGPDLEAISLGAGSQDAELAQGLLDVTRPPFSADPSGQLDSTQALQQALDFAYSHYLITYLPPGHYRVTDTLHMRQRSKPFSRHMAHYMRGSLTPGGPRAQLVLPPSTPGFSNASQLKFLVYMWHFAGDADSPEGGHSQPNINMNQVLAGVGKPSFHLGPIPARLKGGRSPLMWPLRGRN